MSRRYLVIVTLIATTNTLGCGNSRGSGTAVSKTMGAGGRIGADRLSAKGCLDLADLNKTLRSEDGGVAIHSRDYDLGEIKGRPTDPTVTFASIKDAATERVLQHRTLTGANAPVYQSFATGSELLTSKPAADLLAVEAQTACSTVKFKSGQTFRVRSGDARSLRLVNEQSGEIREYYADQTALIATVYAPVTLKTCDGHPSSARVERISSRVTWGPAIGSVQLSPTYARRLGADVSSSYLKFQGKLKTLAEKDSNAGCGS